MITDSSINVNFFICRYIGRSLTHTKGDILHGNREPVDMHQCLQTFTINQTSNPTTRRPRLEEPSSSVAAVSLTWSAGPCSTGSTARPSVPGVLILFINNSQTAATIKEETFPTNPCEQRDKPWPPSAPAFSTTTRHCVTAYVKHEGSKLKAAWVKAKVLHSKQALYDWIDESELSVRKPWGE